MSERIDGATLHFLDVPVGAVVDGKATETGRREVLAAVFPSGLCLHRGLPDQNVGVEYWMVSHAETGLGLLKSPSARDAIGALRRIEAIRPDWHFSNPNVPRHWPEFPAIREVVASEWLKLQAKAEGRS